MQRFTSTTGMAVGPRRNIFPQPFVRGWGQRGLHADNSPHTDTSTIDVHPPCMRAYMHEPMRMRAVTTYAMAGNASWDPPAGHREPRSTACHASGPGSSHRPLPVDAPRGPCFSLQVLAKGVDRRWEDEAPFDSKRAREEIEYAS